MINFLKYNFPINKLGLFTGGIMAKQSEYNKKETKKFIKLTKEALKNEEKKAEWNNIRAMYGIYPERDKGTYMLRPRFPGGKITLDNFKFFSELGENMEIKESILQLVKIYSFMD